MLELLILYILNKYDCTIYKIQKFVKEELFVFSCPSLGAINPALKRLEGLNYVEFTSLMSEGGRLSKTYKITPSGVKYLKETVLAFDFKNQAHLLSNAKACIAISDILNKNDFETFRSNVISKLKILKTDIENRLDSPYIKQTENQKSVFDLCLTEIDGLIKILKG